MSVSTAQAQVRLQRILEVLEEGLELRTGFLKVDLLLTDEKKIRAMNQTHRGISGATDVLSFETNSHFKRLGMMGSVVVCVPVMQKQAKIQGHSPRTELDILLSHGVLHLLGMDHEKSQRQADEMASAESELLRALGHKNLGLIERVVGKGRVAGNGRAVASNKTSTKTKAKTKTGSKAKDQRKAKARPATIKRTKTSRRKARS